MGATEAFPSSSCMCSLGKTHCTCRLKLKEQNELILQSDLSRVCWERSEDLWGFGGNGTNQKQPLSIKAPRIPHDWAFTASLCLLCVQEFSVFKALNGQIRTPPAYELNCQSAFKRSVLFKESCGVLSQIKTPLAEHTAFKVCSSTMVGSWLRHFTPKNTSFLSVRGHKTSEKNDSIAYRSCNQSNRR